MINPLKLNFKNTKTKITQFRRRWSSEEEQHQATPLLDLAAARLVKIQKNVLKDSKSS